MNLSKVSSLFVLALLATQPACLLNLGKKDASDAAPATNQNDSGNNNGGTNPGDGNKNGGTNAGKTYFTSTVVPLLNAKCSSCHTIPAQAPAGALLDIFVYNNALAMLANGASDQDNPMYDGAAGTGAHSQGNLCATTSALCDSLKTWYDSESIKVNGNNPTGGPKGVLETNYTYDGIIKGYALDTRDVGGSVQVKIYNGPVTTGTLLGTVTANEQKINVPYNGNHGFSFQLPDSLKDAQTHPIYAYAIPTTGDGVALTNAPAPIKVYLPKAMAYYTSTLRPALVSGCQSCHNGEFFFTYLSLYQSAAESTAPPFGATATTHLVIRRALGMDGHGGGVRCNANTSPCKEMIAWFGMEFN